MDRRELLISGDAALRVAEGLPPGPTPEVHQHPDGFLDEAELDDPNRNDLVELGLPAT